MPRVGGAVGQAGTDVVIPPLSIIGWASPLLDGTKTETPREGDSLGA
ncbi:MAG TPA: hypothetical protein VN780_00570 [Candidatus Eisenbacteria bacterium]|nr:hypothetical protein [Candidatus Eisenbacteria bacterium]